MIVITIIIIIIIIQILNSNNNNNNKHRIPKQELSHERKAKFQDSENPWLQNPS